MDSETAQAGLFGALADPIRLRILRLLDGNELSVQELVTVLGLPQPTVSRHLGVLNRAGALRRRREGTWTFYSVASESGILATDGLGEALRRRLRSASVAAGDLGALEACLEARARASRGFYARMAPQWDGLRAGLEIEGLHLELLGGLVPGGLDVIDAGTGTGAMLPVLGRASRRLLGVDHSPEMLARAARRIASAGLEQAVLLCADIAQLPCADATADAVCSVLALHHAPRPAAVLAEFARVLRPGGAVVVSDLVAHGEEWMRSELEHQWLGFPVDAVVRWCQDLGLDDITATRLRRRAARGRTLPDLFVVRARKERQPSNPEESR
jgi:ArsR family transcriptional regulator